MDNAPGAPKPISLHLLEDITHGFSKHRKLGGGAYGDVYLGEYKDGEKIAVKVLKDVLDLDDEQFEKEYHNLAYLHHKNVIRLVGYCNETNREYVPYNGRMVFAENTRRMLCFEYMCNNSLDNFIYDESNARNWHTRYAIIKGICKGLEYLHEKLKPPMYHLDLKPANVLLDENMSPKIADFGVSRLFLEERTKKTNSSIGTLGYMPPEYIDAGLISIKFDIFSLGVMIIKMMTGRDGYFRSAEMSSEQFIQLVHTEWMNRLQTTALYLHSIQVRRCIEIALTCVEADRHKRPSIGTIINNLNKTESTIQILDALRNSSESSINEDHQIRDILRYGSESSINEDHQLCPCICNATKMLDILKNQLISYPLRVMNNRGWVHEAKITTVGDSSGDTSTFQPVRPRIKIIDCTEGLGNVVQIDVHSKEPWILVTHWDGNVSNVSIWNHENQTRVMTFHSIAKRVYTGTTKFIEPVQCFVVGDSVGYIHVYSYVKMDKQQTFRAHNKKVVTSLAVHPSEPFVLSASDDKLIKLWNWEADWQCIRTFEGHSSAVYHVKFNPQTAGNTFASCSADSTIKVWNIHSPTPVATLDHKDPVHIDYFTPSGDRQYLIISPRRSGASMWGNAQIWDLHTNRHIKRIEGLQRCGCNIAVVDRLPGRPILLTVSHDKTVAFCDTTTHRYENRVNFKLGFVHGFSYINAIKSLAIACSTRIAIMEIN